MKRHIIPSLIMVLGVAAFVPPVFSAAQVLPTDRDASANWKKAGLQSVGGIPNRITICATVSPKGGGQDDTSAIQTAINNCPAGQVVSLAAGTFTVGDGNYVLLNKGVTIRGAGAGQTIVQRTNGAILEKQASGNSPTPFFILGPARYGVPDGSALSNLTSDVAVGSYSVQVASTAGFRVGEIVLLDETSGASWQPDVTGTATSIWASDDYRVVWKKHNPNIDYEDFGANDYPYQAGTNGNQYSRLDRPQNELKEITAISGNTITFNSPVMMNYRTSHQARLSETTTYGTYVKNAGIENLSMKGADDGSVVFDWCEYCWAKSIENSVWSGVGILFIESFRCELRDYYSHDAAFPRPGGGSYAIGLDWASSEILVENGITTMSNKLMVARAAGAGSVFGYNYADMSLIDYSEGWQEIGLSASHFTGPHHVLFEGNYGANGDSDNTHGSSDYMTFFRNWLRGVRTPFVNPYNGHTIDDIAQGNGPARAAGPMSYSYWFTYIGNVMGAQGKMSGWKYQGPLNNGAAIWGAGWGDGSNWNVDPQMVNPEFPGHLIRNGNWDWVTSSQKWDNAPFAMPNSLYLTSRPSFFGTCQWPWVDPTTGTTNTLPAEARYDLGTPNATTPCDPSLVPPPRLLHRR